MNKDYAEKGLKMGLGTGSKTHSKTPGTTTPAADTSMPMRSANWPGLPGKSQAGNRSNGIRVEKCYAQAKGLAGGSDNDGAK